MKADGEAGPAGTLCRRTLEAIGGPPWILGARGAPLEAPENTMASLRRALALGADGVQVDVRSCATGELLLLADPTLERTTDASGALAARTLPELAHVDAGGWHHRRFVGEPLPLLEEALALVRDEPGEPPLLFLTMHERRDAPELSRVLAAAEHRGAIRVATGTLESAHELAGLGLAPVLVPTRPESDLRGRLREAGVAGLALPPGGWARFEGRESWPVERWELGVDDPDQLLEAARRGVFGLTSFEPRRALAARAIAHLAPADEGGFPLTAPELPLDPRQGHNLRGQWWGRWRPRAVLRNPFPFDVRAAVRLFVRHGAFEVEGLPLVLPLAPREEVAIEFSLAGGSWSPGADPLLAALLSWRPGPGRPEGAVLVDAPLVRRRIAVADGLARRLHLLRESPGASEATMTLRRRGGELIVSIENPGDLEEARAVCLLGERAFTGGRGLRVPLPEGFDATPRGLPFSCGLLGLRGGVPAIRRWAGGLPAGPDSGSPGLLVPSAAG